MSKRIDEKINEEIIRRALALEDERDALESRQIQAQATIETLEELTDLSRDEIEAIARDVRQSFAAQRHHPRLTARLITTGIGLAVLILLTAGLLWLKACRPTATVLPETVSRPPAKAPAKPLKRMVKAVVPDGGTIAVDIYTQFQYVERGFPLSLSTGQSRAIGLGSRPYENLIDQPEFTSPRVLYGYLPLGNGSDTKISFAIDELERPTWVLYVDKNNNEDLTDDGPPLRNQGTGALATQVPLTLEIVTSSGQAHLAPYRIWFWARRRNDNITAHFYTRCHYRGQLLWQSNTYKMIAFEQFNHDGLYRESGLWIDLNKDGALDQNSEHFLDGETVTLGANTFQLQLLYP